ncbi:hypothetical protein WJX77_005028 [Trebouxia sp. C0004]
MRAPARCSLHQSLPRSLLFKSGPLRRSVVQSRRSREYRSDRVHTAASQQRSDHCLSRRALQAELVASLAFAIPLRACSAEVESTSPAANADNELDLTVTEKVFLDIGLCPEGLRSDRTLGDASAICTDATPLGRVTIGLFGRLVPQTVANFSSAIKAGIYTGTLWSKVLPGEYMQAGQQGSKRTGAVDMHLPESVLSRNQEVLSSKSFRMSHSRPGTVSLSLGTNDDDPGIRQRPGYRNTEFVITTGPGPASALDGENIVFGRVLQGYDTMTAIQSVPTFRPFNERVSSFNKLASFLKDERADRVRAKWGKPLKAIVIMGAGMA